MTRSRALWFSFTLALTLVLAGAAVAAGDEAAPAPAIAPAVASSAEPAAPKLCSEPTGEAAAATFLILPPVDYILCSCTFCRANPDEDCQVSPSGYSILCSDWSRTHC